MSWLPLRLLTCLERFLGSGRRTVDRRHCTRHTEIVLKRHTLETCFSIVRGGRFLNGGKDYSTTDKQLAKAKIWYFESQRFEGEPALHCRPRIGLHYRRLLLDLLIYTTNEHGVKAFFVEMTRIYRERLIPAFKSRCAEL